MKLHDRFVFNVAAILESRGMTRADLADVMEVDVPYVYQYLGSAKQSSPRSKPGLDVVSRFAAALNVDPAELLVEPKMALSA